MLHRAKRDKLYVIVVHKTRNLIPGNPINLRWVAFSIAPAFLDLWIVISFFMPGNFIVNFLSSWYLTGTYLGAGLAAHGYFRSVGKGRFCRNCDYANFEGAGQRCPECGWDWTMRGSLIRGHRKPSKVLMTLGIVIAGASLSVITLNRIGWMEQQMLRVTPTSALISHGTSPDVRFDGWVWEELGRRTLAASHIEAIFEGILEERKDPSHATLYGFAARYWIQRGLETGVVSDELLQRSYETMIEIDGLALSQGVVGEPVTIELRARDYTDSHPPMTPMLILGGIYVDDSDVPIGRSSRPIAYGRSADQRTPDFQLELGKYTPKQSGAVRLRVEVWQLCGDASFTDLEIQWTNDGTPIMPDGVLWSRRLDLFHTLNVNGSKPSAR